MFVQQTRHFSRLLKLNSPSPNGFRFGSRRLGILSNGDFVFTNKEYTATEEAIKEIDQEYAEGMEKLRQNRAKQIEQLEHYDKYKQFDKFFDEFDRNCHQIGNSNIPKWAWPIIYRYAIHSSIYASCYPAHNPLEDPHCKSSYESAKAISEWADKVGFDIDKDE